MNKIQLAKSLVIGVFILVFASCRTDRGHLPEIPNIIFILTDDLGYGDLGCFGGEDVFTPNIDRMAEEGTRLTSHYAAPCCTPARASFMTGCYPRRVNLDYGSQYVVLLAADPKGLNTEELTIPELLKTAGYKTGIIGKWHLGDQPVFLPDRHGFDYFFGLPYSNDISSKNTVSRWDFPPLPLMRNQDIIEVEPDQDLLTQRYTSEAIQFIKNNKQHPFFLYLAHSMPHVPIHVSDKYLKGIPQAQIDSLDEAYISTRNCLYPAAIEELDWSVGEILKILRAYSLDRKTIVVFTSDNGPTRNGSTGPFRGYKGSALEGGIRVPCVVWWPGMIPSGSEYRGITSLMDWLPTLVSLSKTDLPADRVIDGKDLFLQITGTDSNEVHESFLIYNRGQLSAVRSGKWKLFIPSEEEPVLYDLDQDSQEQQNVAGDYREIVDQLMTYIIDAKRELGTGEETGPGVRSAGWVEDPRPLIPYEFDYKKNKE